MPTSSSHGRNSLMLCLRRTQRKSREFLYQVFTICHFLIKLPDVASSHFISQVFFTKLHFSSLHHVVSSFTSYLKSQQCNFTCHVLSLTYHFIFQVSTMPLHILNYPLHHSLPISSLRHVTSYLKSPQCNFLFYFLSQVSICYFIYHFLPRHHVVSSFTSYLNPPSCN